MRYCLIRWVFILCSFQFSLSEATRAAAVSTSTVESSNAAMEVLRAGGNAIDAACAAVFVLNVTQPHFAGIGGGGFALVHLNNQESFFLDFRESAPESVTSQLFVKPDGQYFSDAESNSGPKSVGVPGTVAGCGKLILENGKLEWKKIFNPAIQVARNGFLITDLFGEELSDQWKRISFYDFTKTLLMGGTGTGLKKGEFFKQPVLANTLELLAEQGPKSFYSGEFAQKWLKEAQDLGVPFKKEDLLNYRVYQRDLVHFDFGNFEGETISAPSSSGLMVAAVVRYLDHYYSSHSILAPSSAERYVIEIEAKSYFGKMRDQVMTDPSRSKFSASQFLNSSREKDAWKELDQRVQNKLKTFTQSQRIKKISVQDSERMKSHTAHISVVDDFGNAIALTVSVGNIYGSGIILPTFGFVLNSTLGDFDSEDDHVNAPKANTRPLSNMSPVFIFEKKPEKKMVGVLGAAGGPLIPSSIVDFIHNYYFYKQEKDQAIRFPRVHSEDSSNVFIEEHAPHETLEKLQAMGYQVKPIKIMWAVLEGIVRRNANQSWQPVAETRYDGLGLVEEKK